MDRGIGPYPILVHLCDQVRLCQQLRRLCQRVLQFQTELKLRPYD